MAKSIGIDLGQHKTIGAIAVASGIRVLQNRESQDMSRSVVGENKKQVLVGQLALHRQLMAPKDTIVWIKRSMGRSFRDEHVQRVRKQVSYMVQEPSDGTDDDVRMIMGGKEYSSIQISSVILKEIKEDAEARLNDTVEFAVITVPAYFTDKQEDATRKAGQLAGLKVQEILEEPKAAAIAFGVDNVGGDDSTTILVYDQGGGTLDVSVMTMVGGSFVRLNFESDMRLGGDEFTGKIMNHVLCHLSMVYGIDGAADPRFMVELKKKAEQAKKALSSMTRTDVTIPGMLKDESGNLIDVELEISRTEFEGMIAADVARSIQIVRAALKGAGEAMTPEQIDHVLLVGGSSYIPLVQTALAEIFGREKLRIDVDPESCIAYGAAIPSARLGDRVECRFGHMNPGRNNICEVEGCGEPLVIKDGFVEPDGVTPMSYGIRTSAETVKCSKGHENAGKNKRCAMEGFGEELSPADDVFEIIIPKGASFPTRAPIKRRFRTAAASLRRLCVPIYAGFDRVATKNELQATVWIELPGHLPEDTLVEVAFSLDDDGILKKVLATLLDGSGTKVETYLERGDNLRSRLNKKLDQLEKRKIQLWSDHNPETAKKWEELYGEATKAFRANDNVAAGRCVEALDAMVNHELSVHTSSPPFTAEHSGPLGDFRIERKN